MGYTFFVSKFRKSQWYMPVIRTCLLVLQRYTIFLRILLFRSINFLFPHLLLDSLLQMYFCRSFIAYTHVWSAVIIELYITTDGNSSTFDVLEHIGFTVFLLSFILFMAYKKWLQ